MPPTSRHRRAVLGALGVLGLVASLLIGLVGSPAGAVVALAATLAAGVIVTRTAWPDRTGPAALPVPATQAAGPSPSTPADLAALSPSGLFLADPDGTVAWANPACRRLVGPSDRWRDWLAPSHRREVPDEVTDITDVQVLLRGGDGREPRSVRLTLTPVADGVAGAIADMTELAILQDTLARRETAYELLAANTSDIVVRTDITGMVRTASPALTRLLGHGTTGVVGAPIDRLFAAEHGPAIRSAVAAVARDGRPSQISGRLKGRADLDVFVDVTLQPRRAQRGDHLVEIDVSMRDITDRRWVEEELLARNRLLDTVTDASPVGIFALRGASWTGSNRASGTTTLRCL